MITYCSISDVKSMKLYISLQKLRGYFNQSIVSSVAALLSCLQLPSTYCVCICQQRHYWFCFMDYNSIVRMRERFVGIYTLRLGV